MFNRLFQYVAGGQDVPDPKIPQPNHPLFRAAKTNDLVTISRLTLTDTDLDIVDDQANTPLLLAIGNKHLPAVRVLINNGAGLETTGNNDFSPLAVAAYVGDKKIVDFLLGKGAKVDVQDGSGATPLHWAVRSNALPIVQALLAAGAEIDAVDDSKNTPLIYAAASGYKDIVNYLLAYGADKHMRGEQAYTAADVAAEFNHLDCVRLIRGESLEDLSPQEIEQDVHSQSLQIDAGNEAVEYLDDDTIQMIEEVTKEEEAFAIDLSSLTISDEEEDEGDDRFDQHLNLPSRYLCLLSRKPMQDPVTLQDGRSYDRKALYTYFEQRDFPCDVICPVTGQMISSADMFIDTNEVLKKQIEIRVKAEKALHEVICPTVINHAGPESVIREQLPAEQLRQRRIHYYSNHNMFKRQRVGDVTAEEAYREEVRPQFGSV